MRRRQRCSQRNLQPDRCLESQIPRDGTAGVAMLNFLLPSRFARLCGRRPALIISGGPLAKIALITGVTGQDGSYLTEFLLAGYDVHGVKRRASLFNTGG